MRIIAFVPDLLFGSKVHAALTAAGHDVELVGELDPEISADVLIVDLCADAPARIERAMPVAARGVPILAFYLHTDTEVRALGDQAGFELVVPRSRMAREGAELVMKLGANVAEPRAGAGRSRTEPPTHGVRASRRPP
jgi:hypothetical protein